ncbi:MAG: hypothetical protein FK732_10920 [Asgard group archaeon]|nr:hypothetical protein [Asgard group archaeon]
MTEDQKSKFFFLGYIPRCPFYKPIPVLIILVLIALGTWGIYYLNLWAAVAFLIYSLLFYFVLMPFTMCKHCYFRYIVTTQDEETRETTKKLMSVDEWGKTLLHKHVGQKNWTWAMFLIWFLPIVLTIVGISLNHSIYGLIPLIPLFTFIAVVVGNFFYMVKVKCPTCPIREECHSSF